jgi:ADP-ribose pyrophosphatase YjhB (NUDIX family)
MKKEITTSLTLIKKGTKLLIIKNAKACKWTLPGGQIDNGETFKKAAKRETFEETGLNVKLGSKCTKTRRYNKNKKKAIVYIGTIKGKNSKVCLSHEHTNYLFITPKKAKKKLIKRHAAIVPILI